MKYIEKAPEILQNQNATTKDTNALEELTRLINNTILNEDENCDIHNKKAYINIANKRDDLAIINYTKVLTIQKRQLSENHPDIGRTLFNMGSLLCNIKTIRRKLLFGNLRGLALRYSRLDSVYVIMMKSKSAFEYFFNAHDIHRASGKPDALDLWIIETAIRQLQASGSAFHRSH
ncbi:unnamed protein product [Rotaria sp. Silwood2]|nr:unnamed protein product [Rotaria sp. Silwood2]CAF2981132.1 unnamed protein product [Rotaria sp. Silwood2]CAF3099892.1 unnamed protein product [Rotaria sp. Silwood2]CAF3137473.1 unnamed protein product [Rotaria sp. Silwood2]CAF4000065.1 unnamed protein product [Rotaria sp. Silwood2]